MADLVRDLMTTRVVTVRDDAPISAAVAQLTRFGFSALPVVSASFRLVGMISLLDVLRYREAYGVEGMPADESVPVEEIMNPDVVSMTPASNAGAVAQRLRSQGELRVMPIVQGGKLVGVVTRGDLLRRRGRPARRTGLRRFFGGGARTTAASEDALFTLARDRGRRPSPAATTPVHEVMTTEVVTAAPAQPLAMAAELMLAHRHTALPVVDEQQRLIGIVSEADILRGPESAHASGTVETVMTRPAVAVDAATTVGEARTLVSHRGLRTVPVLTGDRLVGVLSRSDLV